MHAAQSDSGCFVSAAGVVQPSQDVCTAKLHYLTVSKPNPGFLLLLLK